MVKNIHSVLIEPFRNMQFYSTPSIFLIEIFDLLLLLYFYLFIEVNSNFSTEPYLGKTSTLTKFSNRCGQMMN